MQNYEINNILNTFASLPHSLTIEEVDDFIDTKVDSESLQQAFMNDVRFIRLSTATSKEYRFIPKKTLFRWFVNLNIGFSERLLFRLTGSQVAYKMNGLRLNGKWDSPPIEAIQWGRTLGFISPCCTMDQYVFPLAWSLSSLMSPHLAVAIDDLMDYICETEDSAASLRKLSVKFIEEGFSKFDKKIVDIVKLRENLSSTKKVTLEDLSKSLGVTRERVRQIENKFWKTYRRWPFIAAFLCDFMLESGRLVVSIDSPGMALKKFLAKCLAIPQTKLSKMGLLIFADSSKVFRSLKKISSLPFDQVNTDIVIKHLESKGGVFFTDTDIKILSERLVQLFRKRLRRSQRVYLALRTIGKPTHYSQVTEVHNELFSELPATEHTVHAVLSDQQYGIVWAGVRGTFALKEWGYKRPSRTLFNSVTEIVNKIYRQTGKPTPYTVIMSEIGKHRKLLNPSSIYIATHLNPDLKCISKELFVPKRREDSAKAKDGTSVDKLDKILQKFQRK